MQHFQSILIVIGILAIAGVSIHGFLLNRKNKLALKAEKQAQLDELEEQEREESEEIDDSEELDSERPSERDFDSVSFTSHIEDEKEELEPFEFNLGSKIHDNQTDFVNLNHAQENEVITSLAQACTAPRTLNPTNRLRLQHHRSQSFHLFPSCLRVLLPRNR